MNFYPHSRFQDHSMGAGHPERPEWLLAIESALQRQSLWSALNHQSVEPVDESLLRLAHTERLLQRLVAPRAASSVNVLQEVRIPGPTRT